MIPSLTKNKKEKQVMQIIGTLYQLIVFHSSFKCLVSCFKSEKTEQIFLETLTFKVGVQSVLPHEEKLPDAYLVLIRHPSSESVTIKIH